MVLLPANDNHYVTTSVWITTSVIGSNLWHFEKCNMTNELSQKQPEKFCMPISGLEI